MEPYVIHIRMEAEPLARLQEEARRAGMAVYVVDLSSIVDEAEPTSYLSDMFGFPHFIRGLDAVLDLLSDLDWIGNINGVSVFNPNATIIQSKNVRLHITEIITANFQKKSLFPTGINH